MMKPRIYFKYLIGAQRCQKSSPFEKCYALFGSSVLCPAM